MQRKYQKKLYKMVMKFYVMFIKIVPKIPLKKIIMEIN